MHGTAHSNSIYINSKGAQLTRGEQASGIRILHHALQLPLGIQQHCRLFQKPLHHRAKEGSL